MGRKHYVDNGPRISYSKAMGLLLNGRTVRTCAIDAFEQTVAELVDTLEDDGARARLETKLAGYDYQYKPDRWGALCVLLDAGVDIHMAFREPVEDMLKAAKALLRQN